LFEHRFQEVATVALLFPHIVTLCEEDAQLMTPYLDLFNKNGILIELFGNNQFIVQSVPVHLKDCSYDDLIKEVVGWIKQERDVDHADLFKMLHEKMRAQMACKAAVKAGDELTWQQMETLLDDLSKTNNRFTCPHGRPTGWLLSLHDIEKKFKRKV
jgi:DNA mismatch repair protein MutL